MTAYVRLNGLSAGRAYTEITDTEISSNPLVRAIVDAGAWATLVRTNPRSRHETDVHPDILRLDEISPSRAARKLQGVPGVAKISSNLSACAAG